MNQGASEMLALQLVSQCYDLDLDVPDIKDIKTSRNWSLIYRGFEL